jgi:hypothetical protein
MMRPRRKTVQEKSVFSRVVMRWVSDVNHRLRSSWESWRTWDTLEANRRRVSAFGRHTVDAENVLRKFSPGHRSTENVEVLKKWAKMTVAFRSVSEITQKNVS